MRSRLSVIGYRLSVIGLLAYSYSQVDLNLTLNQNRIYLSLQERLTCLGYFNRPLSTGIYLALIGSLFVVYWFFLTLVKKGKLKEKEVLILTLFAFLVLLFSYPAFSHDIFNYIFDARIVWVYRASPWEKAPSEFVGDPMLRFMRWVHRPSVYPPVWIGLSLPAVIFSFDKFILQLFSMKLVIGLFHLGTVWLVFKILGQASPRRQLLGTAFFAFSPLALVDNLVSAHNDGVMMFFGLLSLFLFLRKKWLGSFLSLLASIGTKYVTAVFLPFWLIGYFLTKKGVKIDFSLGGRLMAWVAVLVFVLFSFRFEFQSWYLLWVLPLVAVAVEDKVLMNLTTALSMAALLRYAPFLYSGDYNPPVPRIKLVLTVACLGLWLVWLLAKGRLIRNESS